ncbi:MAG: hypothetical protein CMF49_02760 [Legionellales bacterium]|nr:hypothetical protein [Legionellales bacterium]
MRDNTKQIIFIIFLITFFLFLAGFFILPPNKLEYDIFYFLVIPLIIFNYKKIDFNLIFKSKCLIPFLMFSAYCLFSASITLNAPFLRIFDVLKEILYLFFFLLGLYLFSLLPRRKITLITYSLLIITAISASIAIIVWYSSHPLNQRLWSIFFIPHPILSDWAYGTPLVICIYQLTKTNHIKSLWCHFLMATPLIAYLLLTQSRGPLLALFGTILFILLITRNLRSWIILLLIAIFICIDVPMLTRGMTTATLRFEIWHNVLLNSMSHFWFGHGYLATRQVIINGLDFNHAHNVFIEMFYLGGLIGLLTLVSLIIIPVYIFLKHPTNYVVQVLMATFIFGILCMLTDGSKILVHPHALWLCFWLPYWGLFIQNLKLQSPEKFVALP